MNKLKRKLRFWAFTMAFIMIFSSVSAFASDGVYEDDENFSDGEAPDTNEGGENVGEGGDIDVSLDVRLDLDAKGAILIEATTGTVLYEENADVAMSPASVTKIMTLLLTVEAMESGAFTLDTLVTASEHAASIGGSQVYLEAGEQMTVRDMLKSVVVASANDVATALAEFVSGSEELFVARMNERAKELGMVNTNFENPTGLDDNTENHVTSARDIAIMSRELTKHEVIFEFTKIWQDTIRNGEFTLTNTNRMIRYYKGCTGLKTGSTSKALYCISSTATRDGLSLIAVILGSSTRQNRNESSAKLLDYGFANYAYVSFDTEVLDPIKVSYGTKNKVDVGYKSFGTVCPKNEAKNVTKVIELPEKLEAPLKKGDVVGKVKYMSGDKELAVCDIYVLSDVDKITFPHIFGEILKKYFFVS